VNHSSVTFNTDREISPSKRDAAFGAGEKPIPNVSL
jgi:hypothetical protein